MESKKKNPPHSASASASSTRASYGPKLPRSGQPVSTPVAVAPSPSNDEEAANNQPLEPLNKPKSSDVGKKRGPSKARFSDGENHKDTDRVRKKYMTGVDALMCHQCQKNNRGKVVRCKSCNTKLFCAPCIANWYTNLSEDEVAEKCPYCRKSCNCKACLRMTRELLKKEISPESQIRYACHILGSLLPWLRELQKEQMEEKLLEAVIRGVPMNEIKLEQAYCHPDEHFNCSNCETSIVDFHRRCEPCDVELCLFCCQELRKGQISGGEGEKIMGYKNRGKEYTLGTVYVTNDEIQKALRRRADAQSYNHMSAAENPHRSMLHWEAKSDGSICCLKRKAACDGSALELKCVFSEKILAELASRAEGVVNSEMFAEATTRKSDMCSCFDHSGKIRIDSKILREAANRTDISDNYLYNPVATAIQDDDLLHFQMHWAKGEPVVVSDVLRSTPGLSWEPTVMSRALSERIKGRTKDEQQSVKLLDCLDCCEVTMSIRKFFEGYTKGRTVPKTRWPEMLKLKDWPPTSSFEERLPRYGAEFISALRFPSILTHNMVR